MKRNAIARIIIFSLILLILVPALIVGIAAGTFAVRVDYDEYTTGSSQIPAEDIREIEIEWASGSIDIATADTDVITFQEVLGPNDEPMVYQVKNGKLTITYQAPKVHFGFSSGKDLVITVPQSWNCGELTVDAASADLTVSNFSADEVDLNMASGNSRFEGCSIYELNLNSASGLVHYVGTLYNLDCEAASGKVTAIFDTVPTSISFDGVSADLELTLPANAGFTVEMEGLSSDFSSDFEIIRHNGQYICGDGSCRIEVDGISGDLVIRKGDAIAPNPTIPVP